MTVRHGLVFHEDADQLVVTFPKDPARPFEAGEGDRFVTVVFLTEDPAHPGNYSGCVPWETEPAT